MKKIWVLAGMTFREAIRRRIVLAALVLGLLFLIVYSVGFGMIFTEMNAEISTQGGAMARVALGEMSNFLLLAGLYAVTFLSVAMGALLSADTLAGEINSGTIQTIVTKPLRRSDVVLGKWLAFAGLLALYLLLMCGGTVLSVYAQSGYFPRNLPASVSLIYLEAIIVMTFSLACSSAMSALATGGMVFGLYGLAFIGGWIEQIGAMMNNQTAVQVGIATSLLFPTEAMWRRACFEMQSTLGAALQMTPFVTLSAPNLLMVVYAVFYLLIALAIAIRNFSRKDI